MIRRRGQGMSLIVERKIGEGRKTWNKTLPHSGIKNDHIQKIFIIAAA